MTQELIFKSRSMKQEEAELIELLESLGAETKTDEKDNIHSTITYLYLNLFNGNI